MNVKSVVKVMNFHALLRVDMSRRHAERYIGMEAELRSMMSVILNNRNLRLDKKLRMPDPSLPVLRIYLGSDLGFCGSVNSSVSSVLAGDAGTAKIAVGKKLKNASDIILRLNLVDFMKDPGAVREYLHTAVHDRKWSAVELVYNHYYNSSSIGLVEKRIYPLDEDEVAAESDKDDFVVEGDLDTILEEMIMLYLYYELKIAAASSFASENIMRQNATTESLKKLDEKESEEIREERKRRTQIAVSKAIDSFTKQKVLKKA